MPEPHSAHYQNTPNMADVVSNSQALTFDALGKSFTSQSVRQQMIGDRKYDELDIEQAVANRYATTGVPNERTAAGGA